MPLGNLLFKVLGVSIAIWLIPLWLRFMQPLVQDPATLTVLFLLSFKLMVGAVFIGLAEVTALNHRPVEDGREIGVVAADVAQMVGIAEPHASLGAVDRHDAHHLRQARHGFDFVEGDDAQRCSRVGRRAAEVNDVGTEGAHLCHHLTFAAFAHRQHHHPCAGGDDRKRPRPVDQMRQKRGVAVMDAAGDRGGRVQTTARSNLGQNRAKDIARFQRGRDLARQP